VAPDPTASTPDVAPTPPRDDRWVDAHADALLRYALTRLRRWQDAEDAVQETLLAALTASSFRGGSAERTWLIGILRHKIVDRIRLASREARLERLPSDTEMATATGRVPRAAATRCSDPATLCQQREFRQQLASCFATLPARQARVFALSIFDDLTTADISARTGVSHGNVWVLLHRARTRLRSGLEAWIAAEPGG